MEPKTLSQPSKHDSQLNANEEDLHKKSENTKNLQNKNANYQLDSQLKESLYIRDTAQKQHFTRISLLNPENLIFNSRIYQEYIKTYHKLTSLYFIYNGPFVDELIIYDTKSKREQTKIIETKSNFGGCITQLPNGDYFYFGCKPGVHIGKIFTIDHDFHVRELPSWNYSFYSSIIYYNKNVYCFGGSDSYDYTRNSNTFSSRFDLDKNLWIQLSPIPEPAERCTTVIFNGNILISNPSNIYLWLYSIDIDSFSIIPYEFSRWSKVMVNAGERLYLIEFIFYWLIYESNNQDEFSWKLVEKFEFGGVIYYPAYCCVYDKEQNMIYIGKINIEDPKCEESHYYQFNLNEKVLIEIKKRRRKCRIF